MIALVSHRDDLTCDWLVLELAARGAQFVRVNSEDFPEDAVIEWTEREARILTRTECLDSDEISSVWWRRSVAPMLRECARDEGEIDWAAGESAAAWVGFWESVDAHWVNHPAANARAGNKQRQLRVASSLGLSVPRTLVTNDPASAKAFASSCEAVICKALQSGLVPDGQGQQGLLYTQRLDDRALAAVGTLGPEPYFFQEEVRKAFELRVTVIHDRAFACKIESQGTLEGEVDWRAAELVDVPHHPFELPIGLAQKCVALTHRLGLRFGALDFAVTPEGLFVFFEVNANGQWAWIEQLTGLPLRAALADELMVAAQ